MKRFRIKLIFLVNIFIFFVSVVYAENTSTIDYLKECGGEYSGYQYTISSPNYPEPYPEKQNCIYTLRGSHLAKCDQIFNLQFLDFALPPSENCAEDYVEIGDRSLYCGRVVGIRNYPSKDNKLVVRFHSSAGRGGKGFKILVTTVPCSAAQINEKNRAKTAGRLTPGVSDEVIANYFSNENEGSRDELESVNLLKYDNLYPVYRPAVRFTNEDDKNFVRGEISSPPKVESLDENDKNFGTNKFPASIFETPVHESKLFRESLSPNVEIITPSSIRSIDSKPLKISAYLFVPPESGKDSSHRLNDDASNNNFASPPPTEFLLPNRWNANFRENVNTNLTRHHPFLQDRQRNKEKYVVPAKAYGVPDESHDPSFQNSYQNVKTGEVFDNSRDLVDCQGTINLEPDLEVSTSFRGRDPGFSDQIGNNGYFGNNNYPATSYGSPVSRYPIYVPNGNGDASTNTNFERPIDYPNYNSPVIPGSDRPNDWLPSTNFVPSTFHNNYPNVVPDFGTASGGRYPVVADPGSLGRYSECCNTVYSGQRFLLASPGFPSLFYRGNPYECIYTIRPYSPSICRMRFNLKFFNHGKEDPFCSYGHVEIDGRRICGCKKGLSIVSSVSSPFPKVIGVRYIGEPRTQFNGFLIEVIQEPCYNSYPYLSRSKKEITDSSTKINETAIEKNSGLSNETSQRTKRDAGYSYPKPNFGFNEAPGISQDWNSGSSITSHQFWNQGSSSRNFNSPLLTCQAFSFFDWTIAAKEAYLRNSRCLRTGNHNGYLPNNWIPSNGGSGIIPPGFPGTGRPGTFFPVSSGSGGWNFPSIKCEDINVVEGIISSPQYPANYPNNLKKCFRFYKAPNYCQLELAILDFDLENSPGCTKDYVTFSGQNRRYCGRSLIGSTVMFDISRSISADVCFASDSFGTGRGFNAGFSQIPCRSLTNN